MTQEQRNLIAESKDITIDQSTIDKSKLKEAEMLAAQIEAESFSKYDEQLEQKARNKGNDQVLSDEQLDSLFNEMK